MEVMACPHLVFDGVQAYAGQLSHEMDGTRRAEEAQRIETELQSLLADLKKWQIPVKEVSGASTGTVELRKEDTVYTEVQAGSYLFMDATYRQMGLRFENSLTVLATVVSTRARSGGSPMRASRPWVWIRGIPYAPHCLALR